MEATVFNAEGRISPAEAAIQQAAMDLVFAYREACHLTAEQERQVGHVLNNGIRRALTDAHKIVAELAQI